MSPKLRKLIYTILALGGLLLYYFHPNDTVAYTGGGVLAVIALVIYYPEHREKVRRAGGVVLDGDTTPAQAYEGNEWNWRVQGRLATWYVNAYHGGMSLESVYLTAEFSGWIMGAVFPIIAVAAGRKEPGAAAIALAVSVSFLWLGWTFARIRRMRYAPFRSVPAGYDGQSLGTAPVNEIRATGEFVLEGAEAGALFGPERRRFMDIPIQQSVDENGTLALGARVHLVEKYHGITTGDHDGMWKFFVAPGWLQSVEMGLVYLYGIKRPAVRLRVQPPPGGRKKRKIKTLVVAFPKWEAAVEAARALESWLPSAVHAA